MEIKQVQGAVEQAAHALTRLPPDVLSPDVFLRLLDEFLKGTPLNGPIEATLIGRWPSENHVLSLRDGKLWWMDVKDFSALFAGPFNEFSGCCISSPHAGPCSKIES